MSEPDAMEVVVARRVARTPWWSPLSKAAEAVVGNLPTHRDTRSAARSATQIRMAVLGFGILVVVLWESPWAPLALLLCTAALVLPMSESRRRLLVVRLRTARRQTAVVREPARLEIDDKYCTLAAGDVRLRRLRRKALTVVAAEPGLELRSGAKKGDRVRLASPGSALQEDLWIEGDVTAISGMVGGGS